MISTIIQVHLHKNAALYEESKKRSEKKSMIF